MRIITEKGNYNLPAGFLLELDRYNSFYQDNSEKSVPVTLPPTAQNFTIVGWDPLSQANKPLSSLNVIIEDGVNRYSARQIIHSISTEGISTTFYFHLSKFWNDIKDIKLKQVMSNYSFPTNNIAGTTDPYVENDDFDFAIFQVAIDVPELDYYFIGNEFELNDSSSYPTLRGWNGRTIGTGDNATTVPPGYGITLFLKSHRLLKMVMAHFGYNMSDNILTSGALKDLVWLNPVMDAAIVSIGIVRYEQLVPDISIQEFLEIYRNMFNCEFIPDDVTDNMNIIFYQEEVDKPVSVDLSKYVTKKKASDPIEKFKQLKLTLNKNLSGAECEQITLERMIDKYKSIGAFNEEDWKTSSLIQRYNCVYRLSQGQFYTVKLQDGTIVKERVSSQYFDYDKEDDLEYEEKQINISTVPIVEHQNTMMPYLGPAVHFNTNIRDSSKEETTSFDAMLCFVKYRVQDSKNIAYGSINNYDHQGIRDGDYAIQTWGEEGLFHKFYSKRDAILRHSDLKSTANIILPEHLKLSLKEYLPVRLFEQDLMIEKVGFVLGRTAEKEAIFRSKRLFHPYNLSEEQSIPTLAFDHGVPLYQWRLRSNEIEIIEKHEQRHPPPDNIVEIVYIDIQPSQPAREATQADYESGDPFNPKTCRVRVLIYTYGFLVGEETDKVDCWYIAVKK